MKLNITTTTVELTREDVRRLFDDHAALVRLARRFEVRGDGRRWVGKAGPAFSARKRP